MTITNEDQERIRPLAEKEAKKLLQQEHFRIRVKEIINEYIQNVSFAKKVKEYAAEEMDKRLFRDIRYWGIVILTAVITSFIGFIFAKLLKL